MTTTTHENRILMWWKEQSRVRAAATPAAAPGSVTSWWRRRYRFQSNANGIFGVFAVHLQYRVADRCIPPPLGDAIDKRVCLPPFFVRRVARQFVWLSAGLPKLAVTTWVGVLPRCPVRRMLRGAPTRVPGSLRLTVMHRYCDWKHVEKRAGNRRSEAM